MGPRGPEFLRMFIFLKMGNLLKVILLSMCNITRDRVSEYHKNIEKQHRNMLCLLVPTFILHCFLHIIVLSLPMKLKLLPNSSSLSSPLSTLNHNFQILHLCFELLRFLLHRQFHLPLLFGYVCRDHTQKHTHTRKYTHTHTHTHTYIYIYTGCF